MKDKRIGWAKIESKLMCAYDLLEIIKQDVNLPRDFRRELDLAINAIGVPMETAFEKVKYEGVDKP